MPVDSSLFQRDPIRTHVALFEGKHAHPESPRHLDRNTMNRSSVSEQEDGVDPLRRDQAFEIGREIPHAPSIAACLGAPEVESITSVEVDFADRDALRLQLVGKMPEEEAHWPLQQ